MTDQQFLLVWILSFFLYFTIYTIWIPLKTQKKIESWLKSSESDETLLMSLDVITKKIREQMLIDFEEFMLPQARESFKKFWMGAMGNAAKELKGSEEGSNLSLLHGITDSLKNESWYVQALASKLLPMITDAVKTQPKRATDAVVRMGLADER
jgi:hypothetical protein